MANSEQWLTTARYYLTLRGITAWLNVNYWLLLRHWNNFTYTSMNNSSTSTPTTPSWTGYLDSRTWKGRQPAGFSNSICTGPHPHCQGQKHTNADATSEAGQCPQWKDITECSSTYKSYWAQWSSLEARDGVLQCR
jgi:hypothetical protein